MYFKNIREMKGNIYRESADFFLHRTKIPHCLIARINIDRNSTG